MKATLPVEPERQTQFHTACFVPMQNALSNKVQNLSFELLHAMSRISMTARRDIRLVCQTYSYCPIGEIIRGPRFHLRQRERATREDGEHPPIGMRRLLLSLNHNLECLRAFKT